MHCSLIAAGSTERARVEHGYSKAQPTGSRGWSMPGLWRGLDRYYFRSSYTSGVDRDLNWRCDFDRRIADLRFSLGFFSAFSSPSWGVLLQGDQVNEPSSQEADLAHKGRAATE
jgi:hypothetical protein